MTKRCRESLVARAARAAEQQGEQWDYLRRRYGVSIVAYEGSVIFSDMVVLVVIGLGVVWLSEALVVDGWYERCVS